MGIKLAVWLINLYQRYLSFDTGLLHILTPGGACKHSPTCSEYTKQKIVKDGIMRGMFEGLKRILNCF